MAHAPHKTPSRTALVLSLALLAASTAAARSVVNDPPPWNILIDEPTVSVGVGLSDDDRTGWTANRAVLMFRIRTGGQSQAYARWSHVSYDDAGLDASARWPEIVEMVPVDSGDPDGALEPGAEAMTWNSLDRHSGWGRPEFGIIGRTRWPLLGPVVYAASAWLPFASNELYPYAARSISARFALRREVPLGPALDVLLGAFLTRDMAPGGDLLSSDAMSGWTGGEALVRLRPGAGWRLEGGLATAGSDGASLTALHCEAGRAFGEGVRGSVRLEHHIGDEGDRPFGTRVLAIWSLALPGGEDILDEQP